MVFVARGVFMNHEDSQGHGAQKRRFYAHSRPGNPDKSTWQLLEDHLKETAKLAGNFAGAWNANDWGYVAGLWHDMGKYSLEFQQMICAAGGEDAHIETAKRIDHSTAGARHSNETVRDKSVGKVLAYVIAGHHGGLPDGISKDSCLKSRLCKRIPSYDACPDELARARSVALPITRTPDRAGIQFSMFIRMLYSCLVDADFLDTESFMDFQKGQRRQGYKTLTKLEKVFFERHDKKIKGCEVSTVNVQRDLILRQCLNASEMDAGLFSLTVPTGGGKTLSSMAFALKHAKRHGFKKIIYVIPFTSIIEQNAEEFRKMLGDDAVLEHHSNFEPDEEDHRSRLSAENWDAPVIVTTNVQFFESLFANRSSKCRRLHNIAESVVILDEVQTLPAPFLLPCLEVLKELSATYRTSIVLCSATQPAIQRRDEFPRGLENVTEIIDNPQRLANSLRRTKTTFLPKVSNVQLAEKMEGLDQVLAVVNTRKHARNLYDRMRGKEGLYHLSALMCPVHRSQVLAEIRQKLKDGQTCRVISTQLIEAGVDIDFPVVYRALAGIDSIAQAAGRCNREGRLDRGQVFVFTPEAGIGVGHFRQTAQAAESVVRRHADDILSLDAIEDYFKLYYWTKGEALDEEGILTMLQAGCQSGDFPFKTVAEKFKLIEDTMKPVVIPFDKDAEKLIGSLDYAEYPLTLSRKLQKYTVSIPPGQWENLLVIGSIEIKADIFPVLVDKALYKKHIGLVADSPAARDPESLFA